MSDRAPLLGDDSTNSSSHKVRTTIKVCTIKYTDQRLLRNLAKMVKNAMSYFSILGTGMIAPSNTTYSSITVLLNEADEECRNNLTEQWRDHKLQELNFIGIVGALLAGVLTSTGSWPTVLDNGNRQPWSIRACWFCGIVFALFSVLIAAHQSLRLHRLSAHRHGLAYIRSCMTGKKRSDGRVMPRWAQVYAWQASIALLMASVACMLGGMLVLVWVSTSGGPLSNPGESFWDENAKLAVTFSIVLGGTVLLFVATWVSLGAGLSEDA